MRHFLIGIAFAVTQWIATQDATAATCSILASPQLVFGLYDPLSSVHTDIDTAIVIDCQNSVPTEQLSLKLTLTGGQNSGAERSLQGAQDHLRFALFRDPARVIALTDLSSIEIIERIDRPKTFYVPLYGRIFARQSVGAGSYVSHLILTMEF